MLYVRVQELWALDRIDEADRAIAEAAGIYPSQYSLWFHALLHAALHRPRPGGGRLLRGSFGPPHRNPGRELRQDPRRRQGGRLGRSGGDRRRGRRPAPRRARGSRLCRETRSAMRRSSAIPRYPRSRSPTRSISGAGFETGDLTFSKEQGAYARRDDRRTYFLFHPPCARMRADPRFDRLVGEIGLKRYWQQSASKPDYLR
ncbi:MAG: hypothetical protein WDN44_13775 [Sphingomonas sp.]